MKNFANAASLRPHGRLLASASTLSLIAAAAGSVSAWSAEAQPPILMELGWQIDSGRYSTNETGLSLGPMVSQSGLTAPLVQKLSPFRSDSFEGKIAYRPENDGWELSASIRYGRSKGRGKINQALAPIPTTSFTTFEFTYPNFPASNTVRVRGVPATREKLVANSAKAETHFILDFEAGKDLGIGLFGHSSTTSLSAGVRFAHFTMSRQTANFQQTQGMHFQSSTFRTYTWPGYGAKRRELWDTISANGSAAQSFNGIGPSLQWSASAELWSDPRGGDISFDWGVNAALLFGKQKKRIQHQSSTLAHCYGSNCPAGAAPLASSGSTQSTKNITVPNVGGFAGVTLNYPDAKFSFGYRADLFINAIDVGFAGRKSSNLSFDGPYASISIGLDD